MANVCHDVCTEIMLNILLNDQCILISDGEWSRIDVRLYFYIPILYYFILFYFILNNDHIINNLV